MTTHDLQPLGRQTVAGFLDSLASRTPAPGGGAVAAVHAGQCAALLSMVAAYTSGPKYQEHRQVVDAIDRTARKARGRALLLADADIAAFGAVGAAYAMPKDTEEQVRSRSAAIASALSGAAEPPAAVIEMCLELVVAAENLLPVANRSVITDVAAATEAARAAAVTARLNVEINVAGIDDVVVKARLRNTIDKVDALLVRTESIEKRVRTMLSA